MSDHKNLLIIGKVWPEPRSSAAGSRMLQLIELFREEGWQITFSSSAAKSDYSFDLEELGVREHPVELNNSTFDQFIMHLNPDAVLFDRFMTEEQFGWRVAEVCPNTIRILDTEDLHSLRIARQNAWKESRKFELDDLLSEPTAVREIASILRCDLSLMISEVEMQILREVFHIQEDLLSYTPFLLDTESVMENKNFPDYGNRNGFVSIGNFRHEPNRNSVLWLKYEIWPMIRASFPSAKLYLYGSYPNKKTFQLSNPDEGFLIKGRASEADEVISKTKVLLAPLRFGAGLKGKLIDAMLCGTPSVTTSIGAEGIILGGKWSGLIANEAMDFANAATELYRNPGLWNKSQKTGFELLSERFDRQKFGPPLLERISEINKNLESHREKNFHGRMLLHHTMNSTRFMSKWIEAKNR